ncbi:MAG: [protein-PII] uridylyltransferase [Burkholderiales bacterium]|nr:[protein-PII] uridylyltransferase [Burkholderiales bacterium]
MSNAIPAPTRAARSSPQDQRATLAAERAALQQQFEAGKLGRELLRRLALLTDRHLRLAWKSRRMPGEIALIAVGGYGRGQLFPHSDVDILILLPASPDAELREKLESLVGTFWDIGLDVGHSVRTLEECFEIASGDVTVQTNLLESRLITGNRDLYRRFTRKVQQSIDPKAFLSAKRIEQQERHSRHQETNLEPNLKESAGGLRDLNTILWISRAAGLGRTWLELARRGFITRDEARTISRHERLLELLRIHLHYLAGRHEDRLLFDHQTTLAKQLGFATRANRRASERLMQRYYQTAKSVFLLNTILLQNLALRIAPPANRSVITPLNRRFVIRGELLSAPDPAIFERDPCAILEVFSLLQQHHGIKGIGAVTLRALWRARRRINPAARRDPHMHALFMDILRSPTRMIRELRRMHQLDILGRYIPAFGRVTGQMQHDLYHVYTVDEHILKVVRNVRRFAVPELAHEFPLCSRLMSEFDKPELLYLAALFHDIAKGRGGDHSDLGKVDALRFCKTHGLSQPDADLVAWLVEQHLVMSATAQKQDLSDPEVVRSFVQRVGDERHLIALYLLTVADIRGTSPKVWNAWKAKLLEDLFHATRRMLSGERSGRQDGQRGRQEDAMVRLRLYAIPEADYQEFWRQLDTAYFLRHEAQEIAWHTRHLHRHVNSAVPVVKARLSPVGEGLQVLVYVVDQKELFSRICSFFEGISFDIFEAKIHTTRHGYALDTFQIQDASNRQPEYRDLISYIEYELTERLNSKSPLPPLTKPRLSRQLRHFPITPEVVIQSDERGTYRMLSIVAGDRPGLLSRVSRTLTAFDINLHAAKINTLGARAEDTFVVSGAALSNPKTTVRFESELLAQLRV